MSTIIRFISENKEWVFSGIGLFALSGVYGLTKFITKRMLEKSDSDTSYSIKFEDNHSSGIKNNILSDNNSIKIKNGDVMTGANSVKTESGDVYGANSINHQTINYYLPPEEKHVKSWFSERFDILMNALNSSREVGEKEYTVEYVCHLVGIDDINKFKTYLKDGIEPDEGMKERFSNIFGINREWMVFGRGEAPFLSNIELRSKMAMDILEQSDMDDTDEFILITGIEEGERQILVIKKKNKYCYELIPKKFRCHSSVGGTGKSQLVSLYQFIKETRRRGKLHPFAYEASAEQIKQLKEGYIYPKAVIKYKILQSFIDDFLDRDLDVGIDDDLNKVKKIIFCELDSEGCLKQKDNQKMTVNHKGDVSSYSSTTAFFAHRFGKAFPGVRGAKEFSSPQECIERLTILLKQPLSDDNMRDPIWWFRGFSCLPIDEIGICDSNMVLIGNIEMKIKKIVAYSSPTYYRDFVYVETLPLEPTGLYDISNEEINKKSKEGEECVEEYGIWNGNLITRAEYDDGAAVINGHVVDVTDGLVLRERYLTPYNLIICAKYNPINAIGIGGKVKKMMDDILRGTISFEEIIKYIEELPRNERDY